MSEDLTKLLNKLNSKAFKKQMPWDSDSLHRIQAEAKSWFAPLGLETPLSYTNECMECCRKS